VVAAGHRSHIWNELPGKRHGCLGFSPAIVRFLGYDPFPHPKTVAQHLLAKRREMGWSIKEAASVIGVDPGTWRKWECGNSIFYLKHRVRIAQLLQLSFDALNEEMTSRWNE